MKRPAPNPNARRVPGKLLARPSEASLAFYAQHARYTGSGEHKTGLWHGVPPAKRVDASTCPKEITPAEATRMLRAAIVAGNVSEEFVRDMPKRVWYKGEHRCFEARLTERADMDTGKPASYKGWPIGSEALPPAARKCDEI